MVSLCVHLLSLFDPSAWYSWVDLERKGRRRTGNKSSLSVPRAFIHALSHPLGNLQRENSSLQSAQVPHECCCPLSRKKNLKALIGKSIVNFDPRSWHSPASNMFNNTSEKCATSSGGSLGCSKSLKAIESNFNDLTSQCSRKFFSEIQAYRNTCSLIVNKVQLVIKVDQSSVHIYLMIAGLKKFLSGSQEFHSLPHPLHLTRNSRSLWTRDKNKLR